MHDDNVEPGELDLVCQLIQTILTFTVVDVIALIGRILLRVHSKSFPVHVRGGENGIDKSTDRVVAVASHASIVIMLVVVVAIVVVAIVVVVHTRSSRGFWRHSDAYGATERIL